MPLKYYLKNQIANPIVDGKTGKWLEWEAIAQGMGLGKFEEGSSATECLDALIAQRKGGVKPISEQEYEQKKKEMPYAPFGHQRTPLQALPSPGQPHHQDQKQRVVVEVGDKKVTILKGNGETQTFVPEPNEPAILPQPTPPVTTFKPRKGKLSSRPAPASEPEPVAA